MGLAPPENKLIADDEIHNTGYAHRQKITQNHIPPGKFPDQQQDPKTQEKYGGTGQIVSQKKLEEMPFP